MPIVKEPDGSFTLRCLNQHDSSKATTMTRAVGWSAMLDVKSDMRSSCLWSNPVRMFVCSVCGYAELYHGPTIEPDEWKAKP